MKFTCLLMGLIFLCRVDAQTETRKYSSDKTDADYFVTNGMLNGKYTSYYKNGKKKAEGKFEFNNRVGEWSAWDSTGKICVHRLYSNAFEYKSLMAKDTEGPAALLNAPLYIPMRGADSCYKYYYLQERQVAWSKRTWSYIYCKDNKVLRENSKFFNVLYRQMCSHKVTAYKCNPTDWDKSFKDTIDISKAPFDTLNYQVLGFLTKEDWFYDIDMGIMDYRLLGLCPIVVNKNESNIRGDSLITKLCWIYYPQIRKYLAKQNVSDADSPPYIKSMDDVLFWKYYSSSLCAESSVLGTPPVKDSWQLRLLLVDAEHNMWLGIDW